MPRSARARKANAAKRGFHEEFILIGAPVVTYELYELNDPNNPVLMIFPKRTYATIEEAEARALHCARGLGYPIEIRPSNSDVSAIVSYTFQKRANDAEQTSS
jgi:hypothetical protein